MQGGVKFGSRLPNSIDDIEYNPEWSTWESRIYFIVLILSMVLSAIDIGVDVVNDVVDAGTVGVGGVVTGVISLVQKIILGALQMLLIITAILLGSNAPKALRYISAIALVIIFIIQLILVVLEIFLPYFDILQSGADVLMEVVINLIYITMMYML